MKTLFDFPDQYFFLNEPLLIIYKNKFLFYFTQKLKLYTN